MRIGYTLIAFTAAMSFASAVAADEIYRWIGADGVVHYSDEPPNDASVESESLSTVEFDATRNADYDPDTDPWSIRNQAARISESRASLVSLRMERESRQRTLQHETGSQASSTFDRFEREDSVWTYSRYPGFYSPGPWRYPSPAIPRQADPGAARRQAGALEQLDLSGPRPLSINSGLHRQRVQRSTALPTTRIEEPR